MSVFKIYFVAFWFQHLAVVYCYEYCSNDREETLCQKEKHIVCHPEQIEPEGSYDRLYPITVELKDWILYWHNNYRNQVACGDVAGSGGAKLPSASRMREVAWDWELAYVARIHAMRCKMQHDKCRNTVRIPISGQNLAKGSKNVGGMEHVYEFIKTWFEEHSQVTESLLKGSEKKKVDSGGITRSERAAGPFNVSEYDRVTRLRRDDGSATGHFTVLSHDEVARVGCALAVCKDKENNYHFTCNYDYTNMKGKRVYEFGRSATDCSHWGWSVGKSSNFTCLCSTSY